MKTLAKIIGVLFLSTASFSATSTIFNSCTGCPDYVGSGGVSVYPATATASFPYGASFSTMAFTGAGNASIYQNGYTGQVVLSTTVPTAGQYAYWTSSVTQIGVPAPSGSGTPGGNPYDIQIDSNGAFGGYDNFQNNGSTITITSISTATQTNVSTITVTADSVSSGITFNYNTSTMTVSQMIANGYVGIGTTTPRAKLEVNGYALFDSSVTVSTMTFSTFAASGGNMSFDGTNFVQNGTTLLENPGSMVSPTTTSSAYLWSTNYSGSYYETLGFGIGPTPSNSNLTASIGSANFCYIGHPCLVLGVWDSSNNRMGGWKKTNNSGGAYGAPQSFDIDAPYGVNALDIGGAVAIGTDWTYNASSAPPNGLLVEGQIISGSSITATAIGVSSITVNNITINGTCSGSGCNGTGNQTITLSGDSSGSGTTAITVTAAANQPNIVTLNSSSVTIVNTNTTNDALSIKQITTGQSGNGIVILSSTTGNLVQLKPNGFTGGGRKIWTGGAFNIDLTSAPSNPDGLVIVSSAADSQAGASLVRLWTKSPNYNDPMLWIQKEAANSGPSIRIDANTQAKIEFYDTSKYVSGSSGAGSFALQSSGGQFTIANRNKGDTSFEHLIDFDPQYAGATTWFGGGDQVINSTAALVFTQFDGTHAVGFAAPATGMTTSTLWRLPLGDANGVFQSNGSGTMSVSPTLAMPITHTSSVTINSNFGVTGAITVAGTLAFTGTNGIIGTTTNNNATAGEVGEYVSSSAVAVSFPATGAYGDVCSIALSAGDWDVTGVAVFHLNGATMTGIGMGISVNAGNSGSGLNEGDTSLNLPPAPTSDESGTLPAVRISLASPGNAYLKFIGAYSSGTPQAWGRISARRVR